VDKCKPLPTGFDQAPPGMNPASVTTLPGGGIGIVQPPAVPGMQAGMPQGIPAGMGGMSAGGMSNPYMQNPAANMAAAAMAAGQGLTLVHFSAQPELFLSARKHTLQP